MFMIPDGDNWIDPSTGEPVDLYGFEANPNRESLERTETGYRKHPLPNSLRMAKGAAHGQLTGDDYRLLLANGLEPVDIAQQNSQYILMEMNK